MPHARAPTAWRLVEIDMDMESSMFVYTLNRQKLRQVHRREGRYLLRTNLTENDPAQLWQYYIQLAAVEQAFNPLGQTCRSASSYPVEPFVPYHVAPFAEPEGSGGRDQS